MTDAGSFPDLSIL